MDNVTLNAGSGGVSAVAAQVTFSGDSAYAQGVFLGILSGSADAYTYNLSVGGAGAVTAGTPRMTLASDDPAVVALQIIDDWDESDRCKVNPIAGQAGVAGGSGVVGATTQRVVLATDVALPTGSNVIGGVTQSGTWNVVCTNAGTFAVQAVCTNAGTFVVQENGAALTILQLLDDVVYVDDADWTALTSKHSLIGGVYQSTPGTITDGDTGPIRVDQNGHIIISPHGTGVALADATGNTVNLIDDDGGSLLANACFGFMFNGTSWDRIRGTATDGLLVNLGTNNDVTVTGTVTISGAVTNAGTFAVQESGTALTRLTDIETNTDSGAVVGNGTAATAQRVTLANDSTGIVALTTSTASIGKLAANSGVDIGDVDVLTISGQTLQFGNGASGTAVPRVTIANDSTGILAGVTTVTTVSTVSTLTGGGVAHDSADSGNPIKVGAKASATLSDDTMVANADRTDAVSDLDSTLLVRTGFPLGDLITERVSNTDGTSTAFTNFGATASTRNYLTCICVYNSSATAGYVDIRDGTAGSVLFTIPLPAGGGAVIGNGSTPILYSTANTALAYDVSAALTTVYISATGFKSKARA